MDMVKIGLIGLGGIAQGAHIPAYQQISDMAEIYAVCDINKERLEHVGELLNIPKERQFEDYQDLIKSGGVDAVDICTPNYLHCEMAHASLEANLPFSVEKPVGLSYREVADLYEAAKGKNLPSFVCLSYRYRAHAKYMRDMVRRGDLGKIYHIYAHYYKESGLWEGRRLEWRFDKTYAGSGVLGDLGVHVIDFIRFLGFEFNGLYCQRGIGVTERLKEDGSEKAPVTTDDWTHICAGVDAGIPVSINITRLAKTIDNEIVFDVMGEKGRILYSIKAGSGDEVNLCLGEDVKTRTWRKAVPPPEYRGNQSESYVRLLRGEKDVYTAELIEGVRCQKILEAAEISSNENRYVALSEISL